MAQILSQRVLILLEMNFIDYWKATYPEASPIGHELKWVYADRWFRIHSLPGSKRYADTEEEYGILLARQYQLIEELIGEGTEVAIVLGLYENDITLANYARLSDIEAFQRVWTIDLAKERPHQYDHDISLDICVKVENWERGRRDEILKAIADDEIRAMIVCPARRCIVAPYDGGVDVIVETEASRNRWKERFRGWLSPREDGW